MGGIVSDLLEEARHLDGAGAKNAAGKTHPVRINQDDFLEDDDVTGKAVEALAEDATQHDLSAQARQRRTFRAKRRRPLQQPSCGRGHHHRMCRRGLRAWPKVCPLNGSHRTVNHKTRPLTFGERLERIYELEDPTMVERSSTPTVVCVPSDSFYEEEEEEDETVVVPEEEEYCAWASYLQTPGTFHGQLKPNLPGAFSGMCFPQSDPRWICHYPAAVKSIIN